MDNTNRCTHCGSSQREGAKFCMQCGKPLGIPPQASMPPSEPPSPASQIDQSPQPTYISQTSYSSGELTGEVGDEKVPWYRRPLVLGITIFAVVSLCACLSSILIGVLWNRGDLDFISLGTTPTQNEISATLPLSTASATPERNTAIPPSATPVPPTPTEEGIAGVDKPIQVEEFELQFASIKHQDSYKFGSGSSGQTIEAKSPEDELLLLEMDVIKSGAGDLGKMKVTLVDDNGRQSQANITVTNFDDGGITKVTWIFVVSKASDTFTLEFPDGQSMPLPEQ